MYSRLILICFFLLFNLMPAHSAFVIHNRVSTKMGMAVVYVGEGDAVLADIAQYIANDMSASGQFDAYVSCIQESPKRMCDITNFCRQGYQFVLIINHAGRKRALEYRVYDTTIGHMIKEASGKYHKQKTRPVGWAHHIAQKIWPVLTGQPGMFMSKLAYSKEVGMRRGIPIQQICIADYDGSSEQVVVSTPTVNVAPRWGSDAAGMQIFYSEQGPTRTRLMYVDGKKRKQVIAGSHDESTAMHFVIAPDKQSAAYCASRGDGSCQIYICKDGARRNISRNAGNNVSISFSPDSQTLYFCSDYQTGQPQIYAYNIQTDFIREITHDDGYCACPSAHPIQDILVYSKMMHGVMQLFIYDGSSRTHKQLTFDQGSKDECCWSPCGNYIAYEWRSGRQSIIKVLNMITGQHKAVTAPGVRCSYPAWSGCFLTYPVC